MQNLVNTCSSITFGNDAETFDLPDTLLINPAQILDETVDVYRLSIGMFKEREDKQYLRFFDALDKRMPFVENMHVIVGNAKLTFTLAYVMKYTKPYGIFYDIEATKKDIKYKEKEQNEATTCETF